ncbi:MAG: peptidyl-prolyl cis-trans isomerase [Kiritimatiellae bacterium]|nr:peptidyl-prolyl cis-trans isomerase [Kiritimatiellia bacterium]
MRILVNGTEIAQEWIDEMIRLWQQDGKFSDDKSDKSPESIRKQAEDTIIDKELLAQYLLSSSSPYPDPPEKRIQIELRQHPDYYSTFQPEEARTKAILFIKEGMLDKELKAKIRKPSDAEYQKIYDSQPDNFVFGECYFVTRIDYYLDQENSPSASDAMIALIKLKSEIEESENPENAWFNAMINESDSFLQNMRDNFHLLGKEDIPREIAEKLDASEQGGICGPFFTDLNTVSLFRLESKLPQRKLSLEESKGLIFKSWYQTQKALLYKELADKLRKDAKIEYLDD